jgi:hypothetical protein
MEKQAKQPVSKDSSVNHTSEQTPFSETALPRSDIFTLMASTSSVQGRVINPQMIQRLGTLVGNQQLQRMLDKHVIQRVPSEDEINARSEKIRAMRDFIGPPTEEQMNEDKKAAKEQLETIETVKASAGYGQLEDSQKTRLLTLLNGVNPDFAIKAHEILKKGLADSSIDVSTKDDLTSFLNTQPWLGGVVDPPTGAFEGKDQAHQISSAQTVSGFAFRSGNADANKYTVTIGEKTVLVYIAKTQDGTKGKFHSIGEIAQGLATLPPKELEVVKEVHMHPVANPDDAYWQTEFGDPDFSSYMTAGSSGIIDIYPSSTAMTQDYLSGTMIHESGHVLSKQKWGNNAVTDEGWKPWREAMKSDGFAVSQYATQNADEDFAESLQYYETVRGTPQEAEIKAMMPKRWGLIEGLLASE